MFENASQNGPQNRSKIDEKTHLGTVWHHWASLWPPWASSGGTPRSEMYQNRPKTCFRTRKTCKKTTTSENIPWETTIRKLTIVASLQCADKTAGRKFAMVASSQRAHKTGLRTFTIIASLQQLSWKPPTASKFLQRGGLGEAHLDFPYFSARPGDRCPLPPGT